MKTFEHAGIEFLCDDASVGFASNGPSTAAGAIRRIRERGLQRLAVLDICCGVGVIGLTVLKELGQEIVSRLTLTDINIFNVTSARRTIKHNAIACGWDAAAIEVALSDGLRFLPPTRYDLIVSNPPHGYIDDYGSLDFSASWLGTADEAWRFHTAFYRSCADFLTDRGEVWFLENETCGAEAAVRPVINADKRLDYYLRENEPLDPGYFWMLTRRHRNFASKRSST